jgi:hypothetical protein
MSSIERDPSILRPKPYNLAEFFKDNNDDAKLLATISNEFSNFNSNAEADLIGEISQADRDKWHSLSRMVLSSLRYSALLIQQRYLGDDMIKKNYPFYYIRQSVVFDALQDWLNKVSNGSEEIFSPKSPLASPKSK